MIEEKPEQRALMGNEAIARGLIENGCTMVTSYPGTPASEILASVVSFAKEIGVKVHTEWSLNEKVAFETAFAYSITGKRAAVAMKQVGLNVAADPFIRAAYLGVKGGFVVISADDPGPHSSQTEQDSRLFAHFAKVPVFDPTSPREAKEVVRWAFELSEKYEIPVMIRPTTRICHARQNIDLLTPVNVKRTAQFDKNPGRWASTPPFIPELHQTLNKKINSITLEKSFAPIKTMSCTTPGKYAIVASGVVFMHVLELLEDMRFIDIADVFQVLLPFPLHRNFIDMLQNEYEQVLVLEETSPVIELQLATPNTNGRRSGLVPSEGELTPDVVEQIIAQFFRHSSIKVTQRTTASNKRPSLCAGCSHRSAFYAIKQAFLGGIFPSDIGCYTLGINLNAVDTCHCMGACISQGAGFYYAYAQDGPDFPTVAVTIGDSTFFHSGIPGLINGVLQKARFIVVVLDNATTAMTGHQPVPHTGIRADGSLGNPVSIEAIIEASGVRFMKICDPYEFDSFVKVLHEADEYIRSEDGGVAVVIARHPCLVDRRAPHSQDYQRMIVTERCAACLLCISDVECPALIYIENDSTVSIDQNLCKGCGLCAKMCPMGAIVSTKEGAG